MILIEPPSAYASRLRAQQSYPTDQVLQSRTTSHELSGASRWEDGWDETIFNFLASRPGVPVRIVSIASELRKSVERRNKKHKEELKLQILRRVGALIKTGVITRVRREYVVVRQGCLV